jgi:hypothetical protein
MLACADRVGLSESATSSSTRILRRSLRLYEFYPTYVDATTISLGHHLDATDLPYIFFGHHGVLRVLFLVVYISSCCILAYTWGY